MIKISGLFRDYYTTYYYAYAGLELGLAQVHFRESTSDKPFGYQDAKVFSGFTACEGNNECTFDMEITSRSNLITDSFDTSLLDCNVDDTLFGAGRGPGRESNVYTIGAGDGFIVPLFYDNSSGFSTTDYEVIDDASFRSMDLELYNAYTTAGSGETYIVRIIDENTENYLVSTEQSVDVPDPSGSRTPFNLSNSEDINTYAGSATNKNYLVVANAEGESKDFCLQVNQTDSVLPSKYISISSVATFNDASVAFRAVKNNDLPSFIIYGTIATP